MIPLMCLSLIRLYDKTVLLSVFRYSHEALQFHEQVGSIYQLLQIGSCMLSEGESGNIFIMPLLLKMMKRERSNLTKFSARIHET